MLNSFLQEKKLSQVSSSNFRSEKRCHSIYYYSSRTNLIGNGNEGMHHLVAVETNIMINVDRTASTQKTSVADVFALFTIPKSAFVDIYDLEYRHNFGWKDVVVHTYADHVDYESIDYQAHEVLLGLEFLKIPVHISNDVCSWNNTHTHFDFSEDSDPTSDCLSCVQLCINISYTLPLHLRYQQASSSGQQMGEVRLFSPDVFVRLLDTSADALNAEHSLSDSSRSSRNRYNKRCFERTSLNRTGNSRIAAHCAPLYEEQSYKIAAHSNTPQRDDFVQYDKTVGLYRYAEDVRALSLLSFRMPVGSRGALVRVVSVTFAVQTLTTLLLVALIVRKAIIMNKKSS